MGAKRSATYIPGDKLRLRLEIVHQPNLVEVKAVFELQSDQTSETERPVVELTGGAPYLRARSGPQRHSVVEFEGGPITPGVPAPGVYRLARVSATTFDDRTVDVQKPTAAVEFRIVEEPTDTTPEVKNWEFD